MQFEQTLAHMTCAHPFSSLSWSGDDTQQTLNVWCPFARSIVLRTLDTKELIGSASNAQMGMFEVHLSTAASSRIYEVCADTEHGEYVYIDPYQFKDEAYQSVHFIDHSPNNLYKQAGAHLHCSASGVEGVRFAVFAPNASAVSVIGDFNHWNKISHPLQRTDMGYWVLFVPGIKSGCEYKFALKDQHGHDLPDKSDPLGYYQRAYPSHASVVFDHDAYEWQSKSKFLNESPYNAPMSIYEVQLGSWKRPNQEARDQGIRYLSYRELALDLVNYVKEMGYTHIEVLPVSEYPFDGSWGYQPVGLFAPTSRFGDPNDFKYFVDQCHLNDIGVIIDWVPAHFPEDPHGLAKFDGTCVYEYDDPKKGWHPDWNSCIYDFGNDTVRQFLVANALFWFDKYRIDGIRVDAVASMLYLDYSRNEGEWIPNVDGGNHNYEAISLLQWMNTEVYKQFPNAITIAEESTSFAGVSKPVNSGGLGFGFKWNMGWMHDSLHYIAKDPAYRRHHHGELTFSMVYAYDENFVLPISHDEVVHGKGSMLQKMPGDEWQRFANLRAYYGFMFAHPGKKLQFMGNEFAQSNEWNHDSALNWALIEHAPHAGIQRLYKDLNFLYKNMQALNQLDHEASGFQWIDLHNSEQSVLSFARYSKERAQVIVCLCNFTPVVHHGFEFGVPAHGKYKVILNTDDTVYGGSGVSPIEPTSSDGSDTSSISSIKPGLHSMPAKISVSLPPLATVMLLLEE